MEKLDDFQKFGGEEGVLNLEVADEYQEKRIEIVEDIRDKYQILLISLQTEANKLMGLPDDQEMFSKALGLPKGSKSFTTKYLLDRSDQLPDTVEEAGVIIGGAAASVYEDEPWIRKLEEFIRIMLQKKVPILGVCFGHQVVAQSLGGKVEKNPLGREFGTINIDLNEEGAADRLFEQVPKKFVSSTSHQDIVTGLPELERVTVLARTDMDPYDALAIGDSIRTVQFHPEITTELLTKVAEFRKAALAEQGYFKDEEGFKEFVKNLKDDPEARKVLSNFVRNFVIEYHLKKHGV
ncbi:MAG: hypothetical protein A2359_02870 [Candidatus Moranbacteria bacterium RIFOXYB1_FULL_43_19]|nr:MAG: hypothetical protein A2184_02035 [Candidatus Moranbacteria bacterium RIFOXYA1_FULL_44_7]OGI27759.1 MAG: hypothetical protein A2359_02870 [Candidatus Moranbacteria bacterium RIFOXYB1_FULL_43_19]OGI33978.1 MAG: hypothetical protein A2420_03720 [Candidatus Moranbacteria bacterium RIFOXYC1_FULL_44_13]OGI37324.1 MAG: hypothetical protein A2612_05025 [Candidatus Moranbacteria bacterium RIFOXYD1_FULL_44_12]